LIESEKAARLGAACVIIEVFEYVYVLHIHRSFVIERQAHQQVQMQMLSAGTINMPVINDEVLVREKLIIRSRL
jgi:hypothetical protein